MPRNDRKLPSKLRPAYIVFEGISGSGKSTQVDLLRDYLEAQGQSCLVVREPSPLYAELRRTVGHKRPSRPISTLLHLLDRHARIEPQIRRALHAGKVVLADRSYLSTLVYQAGGGWLSVDGLLRLHATLTQPTEIFILDIPADKAWARIAARTEETGKPIGEHETLKRLRRDGQRFRKLHHSFPSAHVIDASQHTPQTVHTRIKQQLGLL